MEIICDWNICFGYFPITQLVKHSALQLFTTKCQMPSIAKHPHFHPRWETRPNTPSRRWSRSWWSSSPRRPAWTFQTGARSRRTRKMGLTSKPPSVGSRASPTLTSMSSQTHVQRPSLRCWMPSRQAVTNIFHWRSTLPTYLSSWRLPWISMDSLISRSRCVYWL